MQNNKFGHLEWNPAFWLFVSGYVGKIRLSDWLGNIWASITDECERMCMLMKFFPSVFRIPTLPKSDHFSQKNHTHHRWCSKLSLWSVACRSSYSSWKTGLQTCLLHLVIKLLYIFHQHSIKHSGSYYVSINGTPPSNPCHLSYNNCGTDYNALVELSQMLSLSQIRKKIRSVITNTFKLSVQGATCGIFIFMAEKNLCDFKII